MAAQAYVDLMNAIDSVRPSTESSMTVKEHEYIQVTNIVEAVHRYLSELEIYIANCPGLKVVSDFDMPNCDVVGKNLAWLTSVAVVRHEPIRLTVDAGDPETYAELSSKVSRLRSALLPFDKYSKHGILVPSPVIDAYAYDGIFNHTHCVKLPEDIFDVGFSDGYLRQQFAEQSLHKYPPGVIEFLLPRVANVPSNEIIALREDSNELFTSFQNEIMQFLRNSNMADTEGKLIDLLSHVDEQVRRLRREFEQLDRRKHLEAQGLFYSFGVLSLVLIVPSELFKSLLALLGANSISRSIQNIRLIQFEERELKDDPFYIPYKLAKLSGQIK
jgi:hypothetical protein